MCFSGGELCCFPRTLTPAERSLGERSRLCVPRNRAYNVGVNILERDVVIGHVF